MAFNSVRWKFVAPEWTETSRQEEEGCETLLAKGYSFPEEGDKIYTASNGDYGSDSERDGERAQESLPIQGKNRHDDHTGICCLHHLGHIPIGEPPTRRDGRRITHSIAQRRHGAMPRSYMHTPMRDPNSLIAKKETLPPVVRRTTQVREAA